MAGRVVQVDMVLPPPVGMHRPRDRKKVVGMIMELGRCSTTSRRWLLGLGRVGRGSNSMRIRQQEWVLLLSERYGCGLGREERGILGCAWFIVEIE